MAKHIGEALVGHSALLESSAYLSTAIGRSTGILPSQRLKQLVGWQISGSVPIEEDQIQPSSLDLRLGAQAFRVDASFLPGSNRTVADRLSDLSKETIDLRKGAVLRRGSIYLVPLLESVSFRKRFSGIANPKSSTGRLDIFTRLISDNATEFDRVASNYHGPLYAEISPRSFDVVAREGCRLLQLRIQYGSPRPTDTAIRDLHARHELIPEELSPDIKNAGIAIRVDVLGESSDSIVGYRARRDVCEAIDLERIGSYDPAEFWEPIKRQSCGGIILRPDEFYILASKQAVWVPPDVAGEMIAYDTLVGEFRVHYAGFFDPGFGLHADGRRGTRAVLEVRSHEVPFLIDDGQIIGRIVYHELIEAPERLYGQSIGSNYANQGLTLAKQFKRLV